MDADPPLPATADAGADADASVTPHPLARWIGASASRRGFGRLVVAAFAAFGGATGLGALAAGTDIAARCAGPGKRCGKGGRLRCCGGSRCRKRMKSVNLISLIKKHPSCRHQCSMARISY